MTRECLQWPKLGRVTPHIPILYDSTFGDCKKEKQVESLVWDFLTQRLQLCWFRMKNSSKNCDYVGFGWKIAATTPIMLVLDEE